jgi:hypothetical protein
MRINLAKHKLVKVWMKKKKEIDQQIIKENITTDEQFEPYINQLFEEIGPLWYDLSSFSYYLAPEEERSFSPEQMWPLIVPIYRPLPSE